MYQWAVQFAYSHIRPIQKVIQVFSTPLKIHSLEDQCVSAEQFRLTILANKHVVPYSVAYDLLYRFESKQLKANWSERFWWKGFLPPFGIKTTFGRLEALGVYPKDMLPLTCLRSNAGEIPSILRDFSGLKVSTTHFTLPSQHISLTSFRFSFSLLLSVISLSGRMLLS